MKDEFLRAFNILFRKKRAIQLYKPNGYKLLTQPPSSLVCPFLLCPVTYGDCADYNGISKVSVIENKEEEANDSDFLNEPDPDCARSSV